jgi:hypothetical protein
MAFGLVALVGVVGSSGLALELSLAPPGVGGAAGGGGAGAAESSTAAAGLPVVGGGSAALPGRRLAERGRAGSAAGAGRAVLRPEGVGSDLRKTISCARVP